MLVRFEDGDGIVHKDYVLEMQNTTRENYPALLVAFIADINKSTALIVKAISELNSNELTHRILLPEMRIIDHSVQIDEKGTLISVDVKNAYSAYFERIKPHIEVLHSYFSARSWVNGIEMNELKEIQTLLERRFKSYKGEGGYIAADHPKFFSGDLRGYFKRIRKSIDADRVELCDAIDFVLSPEFEDLFDVVYYSCNLYDFKLIPKKSGVYDFVDNEGQTFEIVCNEAVYMTKSNYGVKSKWEPNFSIDYYIKKHLIEGSTGMQFFQFIGAARDYLARDNYALTRDKNWNEKHPFVASSMVAVEFEKKIDEVREGYDICISALSKIQSRGMFVGVNEWSEEIHALGGKNVPSPSSAASSTSTCTPEEYLDASNEWVKGKVTNLVRLFSDDKRFEQAKREELYIRTAIENILSCFYRDDVTESKHLTSLPTYRDRATFHKTMSKSIVFDFREGALSPMSEQAMQCIESSEEIRSLYGVIKNHPYHDFYEFDIDFLCTSSLFDPTDLAHFFEWTKSLNLPVQCKCGFKLRKLGNYKANGIYFSHSRMLGLDFRTGRESFVHEIAHHIDLNKSFRGRKEMVSTLYDYFDRRIDERRDYYLKSEELIARAAEVSMLLKASKYRMLTEYREKPEAMIVKMREHFSFSKESEFMRDWLEYEGSIYHVCIEASVRSRKFELLDYIDNYFSSFWGWDAPLVAPKREISKGRGHGDKSPYSESHISMSYYMADIYKFEYPPFDQNTFSELVLDFLTSSMPKPMSTIASSVGAAISTLEFNRIENVNIIKRLWALYEKHKDPAYVRVALNKVPVLHLDKESLNTVESDFKTKFEDDPRFPQLKLTLSELIEILKGFGYE
jgi:hypothetical protein